MTAVISLKDQVDAGTMVKELGRWWKYRQEWKAPFLDGEKLLKAIPLTLQPSLAAPNKDGGLPALPMEIMWELAQKLRTGVETTQDALGAGLLEIVPRFLTFSFQDMWLAKKELTDIVLVHGDSCQVWDKEGPKDVHTEAECELAVSVLLEASRYPVGARAIAACQSVWEAVYATDGGYLGEISCYSGDAPLAGTALDFVRTRFTGYQSHGSALADLCGRTLSTRIQTGVEEDRLASRKLAKTMLESRFRSSLPNGLVPADGHTFLEILSEDSKRTVDPNLASNVRARIQPVHEAQLASLKKIIKIAASSGGHGPLPIYTSGYRMDAIQDLVNKVTAQLMASLTIDSDTGKIESNPEAQRAYQEAMGIKSELEFNDTLPPEARELLRNTVERIKRWLSEHVQPVSPSDACKSCGVARFGMLRCSRCKSARYCSRECQVQHWPVHRQDCVAMSDRSRAMGRRAAAGMSG
ncbi:hypothetical protein DFJ74DRAFT_345814 [Hyaloraphidium curvatum]|nr:hypothetical protein DFJ74DRAFT_345814 [Hyaloraphidium curvatum]